MKKYKICVYAISKNEEKNVEQWYTSMKEADEIYVLDTGSTDKTVEILKGLGVHVEQKSINPWRFDVARNESLKLIPSDTDIYVCTDLDEIFLPGWRNELENKWENDTTQAYYRYNWSLDEYGNPTLSFNYNKIHNKDFKWKYPVHEILIYTGNKENKTITLENVILNHYQESTKNRSSYLPLLKLAVEENPNDTRNLYLLSREYICYNNWQECINTSKKYLAVNENTYYAERCAVMRYIGRSYKMLGDYKNSKLWFENSIKIAPNIRDGYVECGMLEYDFYNFGNAISFFESALLIKENSLDVINEIFSWDDTVYRLLSACYLHVHKVQKSLEYIEIAMDMNPNSEENKKQKELIERVIKYFKP